VERGQSAGEKAAVLIGTEHFAWMITQILSMEQEWEQDGPYLNHCLEITSEVVALVSE
jgi:hypothetical protein